MNQTPLTVTNVRKSYANREILKGIDLAVDAGETVGLIGINGAGKSTLLKGMLDLIAVDAGDIALFGIDHRLTEARSKLVYLAENFVPPHYATGKDLIGFLARLHGVVPTQEQVTRECAKFELDPGDLLRPARDYSKGMRQKLGLIACLIPARPLLILDEPMSGLDPLARAMFKQRLKALKASGNTVLFSTHLLDDVGEVCDRVAILHEGVIAFAGDVDDFAATYPAISLEQSFLACIGHNGAVSPA